MQHSSFQVIVLIVFTLSKSGLVHGQDCSSVDFTLNDWDWGKLNTGINASHNGTIIEYTMQNAVRITTESIGTSKKYIDATLENNILTIFTTDDFENYEDLETEQTIQIGINFVCTTTTKYLGFYQPINPANNHLPEFSLGIYEIPVKLPLHKGFDLNIFYKEVFARDKDLLNNRVTFESPESGIINVGTSDTIGNDSKTFYATLVLTQQLLRLDEPFNFTIIATDSDTEFPGKSTAQIFIIPDEEVTYSPPPTFESVIYRGIISDIGELSVADPTIEPESYSENVTFTLSGEDSDFFSIDPTLHPIKVSLRIPITEENVVGKTFLTAIITANHPEVTGSSTVLLIALPSVPSFTTPRPTFEKSLTKGSINSDLLLEVESIVLREISYNSDVIFTMTGDDSSTFNFTQELNVISITLNESLTEEDLESRDYYSFIVVATHPTNGVGETAVVISLPTKICEVCECPDPIECPECPTPVPPPPVDMSPTFQNQFYSFTIKANDLDKIGDVLATTSSSEAAITYSIQTDNVYLQPRLTIDPSTGELFLQEALNIGYYEANAIAKITIDSEELQSTTLIKLTVVGAITCPDGNVTVEKSLAIQYLKEGEIHQNIFPVKIGDCTYVVHSMEPNDKVYVSINNETNTLDTISFDREDIIFNGYEVPQIQVKLILDCGLTPDPVNRFGLHQTSTINTSQSQVTRSINPSISGRWYTLTNDIDFTPDLTVINIIIEDVNDNRPIFDPFTPTLLGYPEPAVANHIIPSDLVVIQATDKDAGMNAKIKYSLAENTYFQIDPDSGMITPLSDGWSNANAVTLTIYATDNYGAENGLSSSQNLRVRRLEDKHLTIVTLRDNIVNLTADQIIGQLNAESTIKMIILHSALVPYLQVNSKQRQGGPLSVLKMIVYAFGQNGEPLESTQVQSQLEPITALRQLTFSSYEDFVPSDDDDDELEEIMWIVIIGVMGIIILVSVGVIVLMWWFKIRPYEYKTMIEESAASQENIRDDFQDLKIESSPPISPYDERFDVGFDVVKGKRESVNISGSTEMESSDEPSKRARSLLNLLDNGGLEEVEENPVVEESEKKERKKLQGVTFNELVERIDIETEPVRDSDTDLRR